MDQYPLPGPKDIFATLAGGKQFTTLDLSHAYNQMELDPESQKYVVLNTHHGLYKYTRLPFGITSAPAQFQWVMDQILQGMDHVACYIDDVLITGATREEHLENLAEVLRRLHAHRICLKLDKCHFLRDSVEYLGHRIDAVISHVMEDGTEQPIVFASPNLSRKLRKKHYRLSSE